MANEERRTDEELIEKLNAGENACMDELIERYKCQVRNQARALYLMGGDSDDLIQEGMLGLFKAIRDYRFDKDASFQSFARLCISRQLYSAIQASNRQKHVPLNSYIELSPTLSEGPDGPREPSPEEVLIEQENIRSLYGRIARDLSPFEQEVLHAYLGGQNYMEIAAELHKKPKSIDNALQRIRKKLGDAKA